VSVTGRNDQPRFTVTVHPWHTGRQVRADDWLGARHGLELHHAKRLVRSDGRQHEHVARVVEREQVVIGEFADEVHLLCDRERVSEPAKLGALAYARGSDIHLGPGQEQHLAHEAWHVVQQKQGRVAATAQLKGAGLKHEIHRYDAAHAFFNERSAAYDVAGAALAWERMAGFLEANL